MALVVRNGDRSCGSCGCPPITTHGSTVSNVIVQGSKPLVVGNVFGRHPGGGKHCRHTEITIVGNPTVLINGRPVVVTMKRLSRGDTTCTGSSSVTVG